MSQGTHLSLMKTTKNGQVFQGKIFSIRNSVKSDRQVWDDCHCDHEILHCFLELWSQNFTLFLGIVITEFYNVSWNCDHSILKCFLCCDHRILHCFLDCDHRILHCFLDCDHKILLCFLGLQSQNVPSVYNLTHSSFSQIDKIDNNDNIDIRGFTMWKKSNDKMLPPVGIEPRPLIATDSKSNTILSTPT